MEATPYMEAVNALGAMAEKFGPSDPEAVAVSVNAAAYALLAIADQLEEIKTLLAQPIDTYNGTVRTTRIGG